MRTAHFAPKRCRRNCSRRSFTTFDLSAGNTARRMEEFSTDDNPTSDHTWRQESGQENGVTSTETEILAEMSRTDTELSVQQEEAACIAKPFSGGLPPETLATKSDPSSERMLSSRTEVDVYDEITKSEVASLDDWENVHESCLSEIPPVDPGVLVDLEARANDIAGNLDHMLATLANSLKAMSHVSSDCLGAYSTCVDHVGETVDVNIKSMYTLIARCEELNASLKPVQTMAEQVKEIKKTLDMFEAICK